jgi:uncharacterized protein YacL (UPF0231 family)
MSNLYRQSGRKQECPIPIRPNGTSGIIPPRFLKSTTKKYTFDDDDQNTNTKSEKSEKSKKNNIKGNGKKQVVDEIREPNIQTDSDKTEDSSNPSINDIDTGTGTDDTWKTYLGNFFIPSFHRASIVLFALANIFQYIFFQAINFEYVNAIFFIYSVVCNWFLEDEAKKDRANMEKRMTASEKRLTVTEKRLTATEAELIMKANKVVYQDTKIEGRDTKISGLEKENTGLEYDLDVSNHENNMLRGMAKEGCDCAVEMAEKYNSANKAVIEKERTITRGEAKTAMSGIIVERSLVRYGLDVPSNKKEVYPLHLAADIIKRTKKRDNGDGPSIEDLRTFAKSFEGENDERNKHAHTPCLIEIENQVNSVYESVTNNDRASRQAMERMTNIKAATRARLVNTAMCDTYYSSTKANRSFNLSNKKKEILSIRNLNKK